MENVNNINAVYQANAQVRTQKARVLSAIQQASSRTGVDFAYLVNKANQESSLNPNAKASGSSATGLFQFIDQTWLKTIKAHGDKHGLGDMAQKISVGSDGIARVADPSVRQAILALRTNPDVSASMAAELAKTNKDQLAAQVSGKIGPTEMYMAHFLGAGGASEFLNTLKSNPNATAAEILPTAAAANRGVFYDRSTGRAKTVGEIYQRFAQKFESMPDIKGMETRVASAQPSATRAARSPSRETASDAGLTLASLNGDAAAFTAMNGVKLDRTTSSPFAAMVLAQMDMQTLGMDAVSAAQKAEKGDDEMRKRSALSLLANAA